MIYALRTTNPNTPQQKVTRWPLTWAEFIQIEVPGHGLVEISVDGEQLVLTAIGDAPDHLPRSFVIRGVVVNQCRLGLEK